MYSISFHNGSIVSRQHNLRNRKYTDKQEHIDRHGEYEIWHDENLASAYHRLFNRAVADYNANQKRADRQIRNYLQKIKSDKTKHACYECIIQIGNKESSPTESKEILKEYIATWQQRNPNLELVGAYYHADEEGAPHVHVDYVPVARGYTKGMKVQNGLVKAFEQMGIVGERATLTAQMKWEKRERDTLEEMCKSRGLEISHLKTEKRDHLRTEEFKAQKRLETVKKSLEKYEDANLDIEKVLNKAFKKSVFGKKLNEKEVVALATYCKELTNEKNSYKVRYDNMTKFLTDEQAKVKSLEKVNQEQEQELNENFKIAKNEIERLNREIRNLENNNKKIRNEMSVMLDYFNISPEQVRILREVERMKHPTLER